MRTAFVGAAFLASSVVWGASPAASGADAASVLAKHRAYVGWQADDNSVQSMRVTYAFVPRKNAAAVAASPSAAAPAPAASPDDALKASVTEYRRGLLYRNVAATGKGLTRQNGFNGRQFWSSDENGDSVIVRELAARVEFTQNVIDTEAVALVPSSARGTAKVGAKSADVVRISPPDGVPADLYVDPASGAYLRVVLNPEHEDESYSTDIDAYREIAPGKRIVDTSHGTSRGAYVKVVTADANVTVDDAQLRPPKSSTSWTFGSTAPYPITVAVGARAGRSVMVRASVNGHEGTFLLDSGASSILLYSPFADNIGLEELGRTAYTGVAGGRVGAKIARVKDLALGPNVLHDVVVDVSDQRIDGLDGILGYPLLANAIVDVDLAAGNMTILDPAKFDVTVGKGAFAFPIDLTTRQPAVLLTLPKNVTARPVLDTGNSFFLVLSEDMERSGRVAGVTDTIDVRGLGSFENRVFLSGVDGTAMQSARCIRINTVNVGPYRYQQALTCFAPNSVFTGEEGLVGFDFLRHFNWTFDYPEAKLVLTPNGL